MRMQVPVSTSEVYVVDGRTDHGRVTPNAHDKMNHVVLAATQLIEPLALPQHVLLNLLI